MLKSCPICQKPAVEKFRPFCCARCADIDLGKWLGERYRVETNETPDDIKKPNEDADIE
ncbi:MAG: DNA gyrase inhibitor YacG [Bdellovibrionales bacterium]